MVGGIRDGQMPETANVFVLDLGFIFPTMVTTIVGLVQRRDWAWPLATSLVILTAAMLGSLVIADGIAASAVAAGWALLRRLLA